MAGEPKTKNNWEDGIPLGGDGIPLEGGSNNNSTNIGGNIAKLFNVHRLISESIERSGDEKMLLPNVTLNLIIENVVETARRDEGMDAQLTKDLQKSLSSSLTDSIEWRRYFGRLCDYKDSTTDIKVKDVFSKIEQEIYNEMRSTISLLRPESKPAEKNVRDIENAKQKLTQATKELIIFILRVIKGVIDD